MLGFQTTAEALALVKGPMFNVALLIFIFGMLYRLVHVLMLGFKRGNATPKGNRWWGSVSTMLRALIIFPFIPRLHSTANRNPVTYIAGGVFHLALFVVVFLGAAHVLVWDSILGFRWPTLPLPIIDLFAAAGIVSILVLALNRMYSPVLRLLTRGSDYLNLLVVFLPFVTGFFLTHRWLLAYEEMFVFHVLSINLLLVWIPFSRISHFMFYFISRPRYGWMMAARGVRP